MPICRGMAAALAVGAEGVYVGTAFIPTHECSAHPNMKQALIDATDISTLSYLGPVGMGRMLRNRLGEQVLHAQYQDGYIEKITKLVYSSRAYQAACLQGNIENGAVFLSAAAGLIKEIKGAAQVIEDMVPNCDEVLARLWREYN